MHEKRPIERRVAALIGGVCLSPLVGGRNCLGYSKMNRRTIRFKWPKETQWTYLVVEEKDVKRMVQELKAEGYVVEY